MHGCSCVDKSRGYIAVTISSPMSTAYVYHNTCSCALHIQSPKVNGICITQYMFMYIIQTSVYILYTNATYIHQNIYWIYICTYIYIYICSGSPQNALVTFTICFLECHQLYVYVFLTYIAGCKQQTTRSVAVCAQARHSNVVTFMGNIQWIRGSTWRWK